MVSCLGNNPLAVFNFVLESSSTAELDLFECKEDDFISFCFTDNFFL